MTVQTKAFTFLPENLTRAQKIIAKYPEGRQASAVIPLLDIAQRQNENWLTREAMDYVADLLEMPRIRVYAEDLGPRLRLWIEDNGIGIDPKDVERIFSMFARVDESSRYGGTGVGLAIVKKAVEAMQGGTLHHKWSGAFDVLAVEKGASASRPLLRGILRPFPGLLSGVFKAFCRESELSHVGDSKGAHQQSRRCRQLTIARPARRSADQLSLF